jgi:hypothetical protein
MDPVDRFVRNRNVERYLGLLECVTEEKQRQGILRFGGRRTTKAKGRWRFVSAVSLEILRRQIHEQLS